MSTPLVGTADTPRIVRVTIRRADGSRRRRLVKCPFPQTDLGDSLLGLNLELGRLTLDGQIIAAATTVPTSITSKERQRLTRWPAALAAMLA